MSKKRLTNAANTPKPSQVRFMKRISRQIHELIKEFTCRIYLNTVKLEMNSKEWLRPQIHKLLVFLKQDINHIATFLTQNYHIIDQGLPKSNWQYLLVFVLVKIILSNPSYTWSQVQKFGMMSIDKTYVVLKRSQLVRGIAFSCLPLS